MNTTELKKLAEECICHPISRSISDVEHAGEAIKELLAINAELVEALKKALSYPENWPASFTNHECWKRDAESARTALAKAEGGEL